MGVRVGEGAGLGPQVQGDWEWGEAAWHGHLPGPLLECLH